MFATLKEVGNIAVIVFDNPPVNALSKEPVKQLIKCFEEANQNNTIKAIVLLGGQDKFIGGADITEFFSFSGSKDELLKVFNCIEKENKKLTVAAIDGYALGGGLEIALCCDYRIASKSAKLGLPEVNLGILPGAGGTQKLPRIIGVEKALDMMVSGKPIPANVALENKLVDCLSEETLLENAISYTQSLLESGSTRKDLSKIQVTATATFFEDYEKKISFQKRGFFAPFKIIECVKASTELDYEAGKNFEFDAFMECLHSKQASAQMHAFFSEKATRKVPDIPKDTPSINIKVGAVYGLGNMGNGIAMNFANAGIPVKVFDKDKEGLERGLSYIRKNYESSAKKGRLSEDELEKRMSLIKPCENIAELADVDMLIEAVFEKMSLKKELFSLFDKHCKENMILASNTSALNIDEIASVIKNPSKVIGIHFFNPANVMKAVEIVRGKHSSKKAILTGINLCKKMKRVPVVVGNCDGFVANRMFFKYFEESSNLIFQGASIQEIDETMLAFGFPMGPLVLQDLTGINLSWLMMQESIARKPSLKNSPQYDLLERMINENRLGQRTGKGYYRYNLPDRKAIPDEEIQNLIKEIASKHTIPQKDFSKEEIIERLLYPVINEGAKILEEKIAIRASDIDILTIYAYGFPYSKGGPMYWADEIGLGQIVSRLENFEKAFGNRFKPASLLKSLASSNKLFRIYSN